MSRNHSSFLPRYIINPTTCIICPILILVCTVCLITSRSADRLLHGIKHQQNLTFDQTNPQSPDSCSLPSTFHILPPRPETPYLLAAYINWHKAQRRCLADPKCTTRPPVMIWSCRNNGQACAGLGDRIRGILVSLLLAIATEKVFFIDWPAQPFPLQTALYPSRINWIPPPTIANVSSLPRLDWFACVKPRPCTERGFMPDLTHLPSFDLNAGDVNLARDDLQPLFDKHRIFTIATRLRPSAIPLFTTNTFLAAKVKSLFADLANDTIPLQRFLMHSLFRPSPAVAESLKSLAFSPEEPYYGLHVRTGYDTHETKDPRFTYINNNLNKTAESLLDCVELLDRNVTRIFLASDSVLFKSAFIKVANHRNFHVRAVQQKATHFGIHPQETNKLGLQEKCTSFLNLFTDITSLARGRAILNTGSGFADLANLLSSTKTFRVVNVSLPIESQCKRLQYT